MKYNRFYVLLLAVCILVLPSNAQDSDEFQVPEGRWCILAEGAHYSMGWTSVDLNNKTDFSGFAIMGVGLGLEYAYRDNRSLRLDASAAVLGHYNYVMGCTTDHDDYLPERVVTSVSTSLNHMFYNHRWMYGGGLSFEYRSYAYRSIDRADNPFALNMSKDELKFYHRFGENSFDMRHYSLGLSFVGGYRITPNIMIGLKYAPRCVLKSKFMYKDEALSNVGIAKKGHFDHQLSIVASFYFNLTKR